MSAAEPRDDAKAAAPPDGGAAWAPHKNVEGSGVERLTPTGMALRRLLRHKVAVASLAYIVFLLLAATFGPSLWIHEHDNQIEPDWEFIATLPPDQHARYLPPFSPSLKHPFGTDSLGRDVFAQVLVGARVSLSVGIMASLISVFIGVVYGAIAGYAGGRTGRFMMRVVDIIYAVPLLLIVIFMIIVFDPTPIEPTTISVRFDGQEAPAAGSTWTLKNFGGEEIATASTADAPDGAVAFAFKVDTARWPDPGDPIVAYGPGAQVELATRARLAATAPLTVVVAKRPKAGRLLSYGQDKPGEFHVVYRPDPPPDPPAEGEEPIEAPPLIEFALGVRETPGAAAMFFGAILDVIRGWIHADSETARMKIIFIAMGLTFWLPMARVVRAKVLALKEMEYALSARATGATHFRILFLHLLPNTLGPIVVMITLNIPEAIFAEAFLSYIGLGIEAPMASWGTLASEGAKHIKNEGQLHLLLFPALAISSTMLAFNFLGDGLRDAFDPQMKNG